MTEVSIPLYSSGVIKVQAAVIIKHIYVGQKNPRAYLPHLFPFSHGKKK